MQFSEKIKLLRATNNISQEELAARVGISVRSICAYETGAAKPRRRDITQKVADAFNITEEELLHNVDDIESEKEKFIKEAKRKYGSKGRRQAEKLVLQLSGMFAGGELDEEDRDAVFETLTEAYCMSKKENKKYTPKKYRNDDTDDK